MAFNKEKLHIIALGGSVVAPDGVDLPFIKRMQKVISAQIRGGHNFILVIGGGGICRRYQRAASSLGTSAPDIELDTVGMRATRLNAELVRIAFWPNVHPDIISNPEKLLHVQHPIAIAAGWMPGYSTDTVAVRIAEEMNIKEIIIAGHPAYVYDKDIKKHKNAKPLKALTWEEYLELIPNNWKPGLPAPVDPVAARRAARMGITACVVAAKNLSNLTSLLHKEPFKGTTIR